MTFALRGFTTIEPIELAGTAVKGIKADMRPEAVTETNTVKT